QNRLYTSKMFPDNDEIWASIINKTPQQLQDEYNKKLAETFTNASKLTRKKVKGNDGNFYLDVSSPDDTYTETGFPKAFYYDLFDMARSGSMDAGTVFDIMLGATTSAAAGADYVCDGFTVVKKDGYVIIKGARSDAAIGKGILGTRYKITPDSPHTNVMAYVDAKAAIKEAFTSGIGKFMIVAGVAVSTADDVINAINSGKSNKEIAATLVVSLGVNTVMTAITTVASAAVGAAIGTPFIGGFFGSLIGIGIGYITTGVVKITKEAATEQLTKLLDIVM
ncbi:MAG: hypothetical protein Q8873_09335, partial [Bacillota bacterium]|nr:hypothetical protein [Bacillota bacterium]